MCEEGKAEGVKVCLVMYPLIFLTNFISSVTKNNKLVSLPTCVFTKVPIRGTVTAGGLSSSAKAMMSATELVGGGGMS